MNNFIVTLRNVQSGAAYETESWLKEREIDHGQTLGAYLGGNKPFEYISYSFNNDTDAIMFKLTFAQYL